MANGQLKIDKGIPIPPKSNHGGKEKSEESLLMISMKSGDSVLLKKNKGAAVRLAQRNLGAGNYVLRQVEGGFRVWRK